jgi:hypothetical protein
MLQRCACSMLGEKESRGYLVKELAYLKRTLFLMKHKEVKQIPWIVRGVKTMGGNSGSFPEVILSKEGDKVESSLAAKNVDDNTKQMRSVETTDKMVNEAPINKKEHEVQRVNGV